MLSWIHILTASFLCNSLLQLKSLHTPCLHFFSNFLFDSIHKESSLLFHPHLSSDQVLVKVTSGFHFARNNDEILVLISLNPWVETFHNTLLFPPLFMNSHNPSLNNFPHCNLYISETFPVSVLRPLLFLVFACSSTNLIWSHGFKHNLYSDDSQIYISKPSSPYISDLYRSVFSTSIFVYLMIISNVMGLKQLDLSTTTQLSKWYFHLFSCSGKNI